MRDLIPRLKAARAAGHRRISAEQDRAVMTRHHRRRAIARAARARCSRASGAARPRLRAPRPRASSTACATGGDRALAAVRAPVRRRVAAARSVRRARCATARARVPPTCGARSGRRRATSRASRVRQIPKHWDLEVAPGVSVEQRVEPLARVGCYVPGGRFPLPSSLLMTADPGARRRRPRDRSPSARGRSRR